MSLMIVSEGSCVFCERYTFVAASPPLRKPGDAASPAQEFVVLDCPPGICESCARVADWTWRAQHDASLVTTSPFPTKPGVALVLIVRPRHVAVDDEVIVDPACPWEVLMVTRKDEPGTYALPGGKLKPGESSPAGAVRELLEETGVTTWTSALETLHTGFSARGRLVEVFLCRGWGGEPKTLEAGVEPAWLAWPPGPHVGSQAGFYPGVEHAFAVRSRLQAEMQATQELCQRLGRTATLFVESSLSQGQPTDEQVQLQRGYHYAMTQEERQTASFILREKREGEALARAVARGERGSALLSPKKDSEEAGDDGSGVVADDSGDLEDEFKRE